MIKTLSMSTTGLKFSDNSTPIYLTAENNGIIFKDTTYLPKVYVNQNDVGYLTNFPATWQDDKITFMSKELANLPSGSYHLEVWFENGSDKLIYPDYGFLKLNINNNATNIEGNIISSITVDQFQQQFSDLSQDILDNLPEGKVGPQGEKGDTGPQGIQGIQGERGDQGKQGQQGIQGVAGKDFSIAETFPSVASMSGDNLTNGDFVMISSTVEDPDNAKLYLWNGTGFTFVNDMSGATGIKGDTGEQGIQGEQGVQGEQGKQGIQGVQGETGLAGKDGTNGKDAVINVVTQAEYDKIPDKTGVYFIGG